MEGRIKAVEEKVPIGAAEVKALFGKGSSIVAGCVVTEGRLQRGAYIEVRRNRKKVVFEGALASLRRVKDDVSVVDEGTECGVGAEVRTGQGAGREVLHACTLRTQRVAAMAQARAQRC